MNSGNKPNGRRIPSNFNYGVSGLNYQKLRRGESRDSEAKESSNYIKYPECFEQTKFTPNPQVYDLKISKLMK